MIYCMMEVILLIGDSVRDSGLGILGRLLRRSGVGNRSWLKIIFGLCLITKQKKV